VNEPPAPAAQAGADIGGSSLTAKNEAGGACAGIFAGGKNARLSTLGQMITLQAKARRRW
jgi:hypothetical protein